RRPSSTQDDGPDAELPVRERRHARPEPPVAEAADVRLAVHARAVADGEVDDPQAEARGTVQQVEVAERVEVAEVLARLRDLLVRAAREHLRPAERVLHVLAGGRLEDDREEPVAERVEEPHRTGLE